MTLPDEERARADLHRHLHKLFDSAERVHNAAIEVVTRRNFVISKPAGFNNGVFVVLFSLLTKACKTFRAIQIVCDYGLGQDAAVLARQLFETTVTVAFILQKDSIVRAAMLAAYEDQRLLVLLQKARETEGLQHLASDGALSKVEAKVRAWDEVIGNEIVESVRRHWSGRSLEWAAKEVGLADAYGTMFRYTSAFAHVSDVTGHFFIKPGDDAPTLKLSPGDDQIKPVLESSVVSMHIVVSSIDEAFGLGETETLAKISAELPRKNTSSQPAAEPPKR